MTACSAFAITRLECGIAAAAALFLAFGAAGAGKEDAAMKLTSTAFGTAHAARKNFFIVRYWIRKPLNYKDANSQFRRNAPFSVI